MTPYDGLDDGFQVAPPSVVESASNTCRMVRDMMERLSTQIVEHGGVIVDYAGDGILAMWNAPAPQQDHGARAARAALAMLDELPDLNAQWHDLAGVPLALGIGINTGPAMVGNTGSSRKFKYGPHGHTVTAPQHECCDAYNEMSCKRECCGHSTLGTPRLTRRVPAVGPAFERAVASVSSMRTNQRRRGLCLRVRRDHVVAQRVAGMIDVALGGDDRLAGGKQFRNGDEAVALGAELRHDDAQGLGGVGAAAVGVHDDDGARPRATRCQKASGDWA